MSMKDSPTSFIIMIFAIGTNFNLENIPSFFAKISFLPFEGMFDGVFVRPD